MGHRRQSAPRHGSLAYLPRKRARYGKGRVRHWLPYNDKEVRFQGFAGFKAGMTHVAYIEDQEHSPFFGKELVKAVTVLETPPLVLFGVKVYHRDEYGLNAIGELYAKELKPELGRKIQIPNPETYNFEEKLKDLESKIQDHDEIRGLFHTQPWKSSVPRIKPDILEINVTGGNGSAKAQFNFVLERLGQEIRVRDVIEEGTLIDTIGVSKGKGFQGAVKKFGIKLMSRKNRKGKRRVGCIGPWKPPKLLYTIARSGQMGYHQRVEYNKRILKISEDSDEINPKGGFIRYGLVKSDYLIILGSVPGPKKRLIRLRDCMRPRENFKVSAPEITYISKLSQQGK
ncbi:MAG: 50S ribosomal protein L3 [Candidatus Lokiarchaeota archaeon]|nr:50S ribosomal protein L3 [Candidatus Harpocratesius repetitus]